MRTPSLLRTWYHRSILLDTVTTHYCVLSTSTVTYCVLRQHTIYYSTSTVTYCVLRQHTVYYSTSTVTYCVLRQRTVDYSSRYCDSTYDTYLRLEILVTTHDEATGDIRELGQAPAHAVDLNAELPARKEAEGDTNNEWRRG